MQWLDRSRSGDYSTTAMTWHGVQLRQYGDTVVAIGTQTHESTYKGSPSSGELRVTHVFVRSGEGWVIAAMHLSPTVPTAAPPTGASRSGDEAA